jgi:hypothetical protein
MVARRGTRRSAPDDGARSRRIGLALELATYWTGFLRAVPGRQGSRPAIGAMRGRVARADKATQPFALRGAEAFDIAPACRSRQSAGTLAERLSHRSMRIDSRSLISIIHR